MYQPLAGGGFRDLPYEGVDMAAVGRLAVSEAGIRFSRN